jgi:hypothetical protein
MSQSKRDDLNLAEVKAVLGRLQQISRKASGAGTRTADGGADFPGAPRPAPAGDGRSAPSPGKASPISRVLHGPGHVKATALIVLLLAFFAGLALFVGVGPRPIPVKEPPPAAEPIAPPGTGNRLAGTAVQEGQTSPAAALQIASDLMASGQVRAARDTLLRVAQIESADVSWALARSYDPNYLVTIGTADANPNVAEATRWYRTWFELAVRQGLVADSVSLDRIIRSMNELNNR